MKLFQIFSYVQIKIIENLPIEKKPEIFMIGKIGPQENLPENMGIIPILKMKKKLFFSSFFILLR